MVSCAVSNCKNTSGKFSKNKDGITFHRFPKDKDRRKQWEVAVNREDKWTSSESSVVCCEHFDVQDFYITDRGLRRLSIDAVPSKNISPCQAEEPTMSKLGPVDIKPTDTEEVIQLKHKVRRLEIIAADRKRRLNVMWQRKWRLKKKLEQMKTYVKHLIKYKQSTKNAKTNESDMVAMGVNEIT